MVISWFCGKAAPPISDENFRRRNLSKDSLNVIKSGLASAAREAPFPKCRHSSLPHRGVWISRLAVSVPFNQSHKINHYHKSSCIAEHIQQVSRRNWCLARSSHSYLGEIPTVTDGAQFVRGTDSIVRTDIGWIMRSKYFYLVQQVDYRFIRLPCTATSLQSSFLLRKEKRKREECRLEQNTAFYGMKAHLGCYRQRALTNGEHFRSKVLDKFFMDEILLLRPSFSYIIHNMHKSLRV